MGFFEASNFYPDYIMWITEIDKQYITFIDPKGIRMLERNINNPKIQFYKTIKELGSPPAAFMYRKTDHFKFLYHVWYKRCRCQCLLWNKKVRI